MSVVGFSAVMINHGFANADLTPASGTVQFTLTKRMSQPGQTIMPTAITTSLDASGNLSQSLTANTDTGTIPQDAQWRVDIRVSGAPETQDYIVVAPSETPVDLYTLLPQQPDAG